MSFDPQRSFKVYEALSPDGLYDALGATAIRLIATLLHCANTAATEQERQRFKARMIEVRDERWAVGVDDRAGQLAYIMRWKSNARTGKPGSKPADESRRDRDLRSIRSRLGHRGRRRHRATNTVAGTTRRS